jgi:hypothetical protein
MCQDFWHHDTKENSLAICVCDGAGSARLSRVGAYVVAAEVTNALITQEAVCDESMKSAFRTARSKLDRWAAAGGCSVSDLACTVLAVWANPRSTYMAHLGDGVIIRRSRTTQEVTIVSGPERGEFANETYFLTSSNWENHVRVKKMPAEHSLCIMTDGCQSAALESPPVSGPYRPFCDPLFDFAANSLDGDAAESELRKLLTGAKMRQTSRDDKTVVLAHFIPEVPTLLKNVSAAVC